MKELIAAVESLGLRGQEASDFIKEQLDNERKERALEREYQKEETLRRAEERRREDERKEEERRREDEKLQLEREERERERTFQYEMAQLQSTRSQQEHSTGANRHSASLPKIQSFEDGKDDLHSYLQRFERYANNCGWPMEE